VLHNTDKFKREALTFTLCFHFMQGILSANEI